MAANSVTGSVQGATTPIPIDLAKFRYGVGLIATVTGSATYDVEVTGDRPSRSAFANWNKHDLMKSLSASQNGNLAYPVTAVRLYITATTGSVTLSVVQAD